MIPKERYSRKKIIDRIAEISLGMKSFVGSEIIRKGRSVDCW